MARFPDDFNTTSEITEEHFLVVGALSRTPLKVPALAFATREEIEKTNIDVEQLGERDDEMRDRIDNIEAQHNKDVAALSTNKADKTALSTLEGKVNTKADASALATTNGNVTALQNGKADKSSLATTDAKIAELAAKHITDYNEVKDDLAHFAKTWLLPEHAKYMYAYGISFDTNVSSPSCLRVGRNDLHMECPIQNSMRGCLLNDRGEVVKYLSTDSWLGEPLDGEGGQVMVELPRTFVLFETVGTKNYVWLSEYPIEGFREIPVRYVSAYEASLDRTTLKLCSIKNTDTRYRGGNNNASYDDTDHSLLGRPATSISRTNFRAYARKRNDGATNEWNMYTMDIHEQLYWFFVVEYATLNSQAAFNAALTSEGFKQGGLGDGVTNYDYDKWNTWCARNPFVPCGYTDEFGNGTGVKLFTTPDGYGVAGHKCYVPRYHGIENPFGHLWKWCDGVNIMISADVANGGNGRSMAYMQRDANLITADIDNNCDGMEYVGDECRTQNYVRRLCFGDTGSIIPSEVGNGASSNAFFCDYHYTNIPASGTNLRGVLLGGLAYNGSSSGFAFVNSYDAPSTTYADVGSRLCFIPETTK